MHINNPLKNLRKKIKKIKIRIRIPGIDTKWREKDDHFWLVVRWDTGDNEGYHSIITTFAQRRQKEQFTVLNSFSRGPKGYAEAKKSLNFYY